ncbi:MAG: hypothetical protein M1814_003540 [Vezdaea aestivalis]|nr:MAG: hypothetical protein M1814_003540 [Vezdaea aestivalis]
MVTHKGITVEIRAGKTALPEYPDIGERPASRSKIVRYIKAPPSTAYSIRWAIEEGYISSSEALLFAVKVDGKAVDSQIGSKNGRCSGTIDGVIIKDIQKGSWQKRPLTFQIVVTTELSKHGHPRNESFGEAIGHIQVLIHRIERVGIVYTPSRQSADTFNFDVKALPEDLLKGKSQSRLTKAGPLTTIKKPPTFRRVRYPDGKDQDCATMAFHFLYRSEDDLEKLSIVSKGMGESDSIFSKAERNGKRLAQPRNSTSNPRGQPYVRNESQEPQTLAEMPANSTLPSRRTSSFRPFPPEMTIIEADEEDEQNEHVQTSASTTPKKRHQPSEGVMGTSSLVSPLRHLSVAKSSDDEDDFIIVSSRNKTPVSKKPRLRLDPGSLGSSGNPFSLD